MAKLAESFARLRKEEWTKNPGLLKNDPTCKFQRLSDGSGTYVYDEYSVIISAMPPGLNAEAYWLEFARSPNRAVNNAWFSRANVFTKRNGGDPHLGDLYDIDILGPDDGSIVLVALSPAFGIMSGDSWFDIQTVSCEKYGSHPENGAREFGFEYVSEGVKFYTRGVSRPGNAAIRVVGAGPQMASWTAMMKGISEAIRGRGGKPKENSFKVIKYTAN
jgi:hypothetical protein